MIAQRSRFTPPVVQLYRASCSHWFANADGASPHGTRDVNICNPRSQTYRTPVESGTLETLGATDVTPVEDGTPISAPANEKV
jgi:hypothetical protein